MSSSKSKGILNDTFSEISVSDSVWVLELFCKESNNEFKINFSSSFGLNIKYYFVLYYFLTLTFDFLFHLHILLIIP